MANGLTSAGRQSDLGGRRWSRDLCSHRFATEVATDDRWRVTFMAISNAERVGKALELLNQGLFPFMKRELKAFYGDTWFEQASANLREYQMPGKGIGDEHWDTQALLLVMWDQWNTVFRNVLGQAERSLVSELREVRNKWAHQEPFSTDDAYRALDSVQRLLASVSAADQSTEVERQRQELLRIRFEDQARKEVRKAAVAPIE